MRLDKECKDKKKRSMLKDVKLNEVSSVGRGANQGALVSLLKMDTETQTEEREETPQTEENMDLEKKLEELEASNTELADKLAKSDWLASLNDLQKAHYAKLEGEDKEAFEKASAEDRQQIVTDAIAKAEAEDEILEINGSEVRKSVLGAEAFELLKTAQEEKDKLAKEIEDEKAKVVQKQLEDDAEKEFAHLPGTPVAKAKVLEFARSDDEVMKVLKAADAHAKTLTEEVGTNSAAEVNTEGLNSEEQLNELAKAYAEENKISTASAYLEVIKTDQGKKLYFESLRD